MCFGIVAMAANRVNVVARAESAPVTAETDQLRLIVEGWVRDNPKNLGVSAGWAVPLALSLAFPCPK